MAATESNNNNCGGTSCPMKETSNTKLKQLKEVSVSTMLKQGFLPDQTHSFSLSPSRSKTLNSQFPSSPQQTPTHHQTVNRPTLFQMMSQEHTHQQNSALVSSRLSKLLANAPFDNNFKTCDDGSGGGNGDVRLVLVSKDGMRVSMDVHRTVLEEKSRYFEDKLRCERAGVSSNHRRNHSVEIEISECDDLEVYVETVVLMYSDDLRKKLIGQDVDKILGLLKVSSAIMFDAGIAACLEYLEAVPWSNDEEENILSQLNELELLDSGVEVLRRVSAEPSTSARPDEIILRLLSGVIQAKDDKARREMKSLISRLLRDDASESRNRIDVSRDIFYHLCHRCLSSLILCLSEAASMDENRRDRGVLMGEIAREADNLHWIVDILIDKKIGEEFVKLWADQKELAVLHSKIPVMYRHEISRITAQLCVAIGRGHILVPKDTRLSLLSTWLEALYEDFGWMRRASRSIDKKLVEDGLGQTILTLPLLQQQAIFLNWFDRFLNKGDDCPNIQRAFEIWWRRAFVRQNVADLSNSHLQITKVGDFTISRGFEVGMSWGWLVEQPQLFHVTPEPPSSTPLPIVGSIVGYAWVTLGELGAIDGSLLAIRRFALTHYCAL